MNLRFPNRITRFEPHGNQSHPNQQNRSTKQSSTARLRRCSPLLRLFLLCSNKSSSCPHQATATTTTPSLPNDSSSHLHLAATGKQERLLCCGRAPMHPKFSRVAHRLLCCGRHASGEDLADERSGSIRWVFSLRELRSATNSFNYDNKIGEGSLGSVYWGQVWDGSQIAVKKLKNARNGTEKEFASEVETLGRVRHKNLLSLRGYCADGPERILVYDYMPNSSLYAHLHGTHSSECLLDWRRRTFIATGAARSLVYLHNHVTPPIIHGSIKATNVLLDSDFQAHVGDFGLIRLISDEIDHDKIISENQRGYLAPEYIMFGKPTAGCDIYSFGIILLELTSGRRPVEKSGSVKMYGIRNWILPLAKEGRYDEIADSKLNDKYSESELKRVVLIGLACTHREPEKRPTMLEVVSLLKGESKEMLSRLENEELFRPDSKASSLGTSTPEVSSTSDCVPKSDQGLVVA